MSMVRLLRIYYGLMVMKLELALPMIELMSSIFVVVASSLKFLNLELKLLTFGLMSSIFVVNLL